MIVKLLFMLTSYLSMSNVDSYVLFAANIDDFRSLANKIIPGRLADQLANMASKRVNLSYKHNTNEPTTKDLDDESTSDEISENSSEDSDYSDAFYESTKYPMKDKLKSSKKKYTVANENIDLDELVKRVKEKLENEYRVIRNENDVRSNRPSSVATTKPEDKLEDYYYKDETMDVNFEKASNEEVKKRPIGPRFTTESNNFEGGSQYDGVNIDYNEEDINKAPAYSEENAEKTEYVQENMKQNKATKAQHQSYIAPLKEDNKQLRDHEIRKPQKYAKEEASKTVKKVEKKVSEYYEENTKNVVTNENAEETNSQENMQAVKETPVYYEENAEAHEEAEDNNGDMFREIDMMKLTNDSYEDYVTPKRDNIFDSGEPVTKQEPERYVKVQKHTPENSKFQLENSRSKIFAEPFKVPGQRGVAANDQVIKPSTKKASVATPRPKFIKGRTASMWYKDPNIENYDDSTQKMKADDNKQTTKKRLRTMFPTKAHAKISSPNYFAKLPAVAEKYNFNEPIPEKDREPEVIKHIGNPPARINKKVKI